VIGASVGVAGGGVKVGSNATVVALALKSAAVGTVELAVAVLNGCAEFPC
jgi:hypothetical protein